jgi:hypothetical protein
LPASLSAFALTMTMKRMEVGTRVSRTGAEAFDYACLHKHVE